MELRDDKLFCCFTAWLKVVIKNAKIDYIRSQKRHIAEVSIEDNSLMDKLIYFSISDSTGFEDKFSFEDKTLSVAFKKLSPQRQRILELIFVHNLTPEDIADTLHCSIGHVYNMRSLALKELQSEIKKEGN